MPGVLWKHIGKRLMNLHVDNQSQRIERLAVFLTK